MREVLPRLATDRPIWSLRKYEYRESLRTFVMQVGNVDKEYFIHGLEMGMRPDLKLTRLIKEVRPFKAGFGILPGYRFCRLFDPSNTDRIGYGLNYLLVDLPDDVQAVDLMRYSYDQAGQQVEGLAPWDQQLKSYLKQYEPKPAERTPNEISYWTGEHNRIASYLYATGKDAIVIDSQGNYWCLSPDRIGVIDVLLSFGERREVFQSLAKAKIGGDDPMVHFISHAKAVESAHQEGLPVPRLVLLEEDLQPSVEVTEARRHIGLMMEMVNQIERIAVHMKMQNRTAEQDYELDFLAVVAAYRALVHLRDAMLSLANKIALNIDASVRTLAPAIDRWVLGMKSTGSSGLPVTIEEISARRASQGMPSIPAAEMTINTMREIIGNAGNMKTTMDGFQFHSGYVMTLIITLLSMHGPTEEVLLADEAFKTFPAAY